MSARIRNVLPLLTLLLLLPGLLHAQQRGGGGGMGGMGMGGGQMLESLTTSPAGHALEHRAELGLTEEQATRLEAMNKAWEEEHEEILTPMRARIEALQAAMQQGGGQGMRQGGGGGATGGDMQAMRASMEGLQAARQSQMEAMGSVLTVEQMRELRQMLQPRRPGGMG